MKALGLLPGLLLYFFSTLILGSCTTAQGVAYRIPADRQSSFGLGLRLVGNAFIPGVHWKQRLTSKDEFFAELQLGSFLTTGTELPTSLEIGFQNFFEAESRGGPSSFISLKIQSARNYIIPDLLVGLRGFLVQDNLLLTGGISTGILQLVVPIAARDNLMGRPQSGSFGDVGPILPFVLDGGIGLALDHGGLFGRITMASLMPIISLEGYYSP